MFLEVRAHGFDLFVRGSYLGANVDGIPSEHWILVLNGLTKVLAATKQRIDSL